MTKVKINCKIFFLSSWLNLKLFLPSMKYNQNKDYVSVNDINKINNLIKINSCELDKIIYYPKVYIISGQNEILLDESKILSNKFNNSELIIVESQSHAFLTVYGLFNTNLQKKVLEIIANNLIYL
jgi:hypothetical protein